MAAIASFSHCPFVFVKRLQISSSSPAVTESFHFCVARTSTKTLVDRNQMPSSPRTSKKDEISIFYGRNPFKSESDDGAFERTVMRPKTKTGRSPAALIIRRILIKIFVRITKLSAIAWHFNGCRGGRRKTCAVFN